MHFERNTRVASIQFLKQNQGKRCHPKCFYRANHLINGGGGGVVFSFVRSFVTALPACLPSQHREMKIRGPPSRTSRTRLPSHCGTELLTGSLLICRDGATQWCDGNLTRSSDSKKVKEEDEEWMTVSLRGIRRSGWGWKSFCTEEWFIVKTLQPSHSILSPDKWWLLCAVYSLTAHYRHQYLIVYYTSKISCPPRQATHRSVIAAKLI